MGIPNSTARPTDNVKGFGSRGFYREQYYEEDTNLNHMLRNVRLRCPQQI